MAGRLKPGCLTNLSASPFPVARTVARNLFSEGEQYAQSSSSLFSNGWSFENWCTLQLVGS